MSRDYNPFPTFAGKRWAHVERVSDSPLTMDVDGWYIVRRSNGKDSVEYAEKHLKRKQDKKPAFRLPKRGPLVTPLALLMGSLSLAHAVYKTLLSDEEKEKQSVGAELGHQFGAMSSPPAHSFDDDCPELFKFLMTVGDDVRKAWRVLEQDSHFDYSKLEDAIEKGQRFSKKGERRYADRDKRILELRSAGKTYGQILKLLTPDFPQLSYRIIERVCRSNGQGKQHK